MNVNQVTALSAHRGALQALGFSGEDSLEQFIGAAQVAGPELAAYLGVSVNTLVTTVNTTSAFASTIPQATLNIISQATYSLGVAIDHIPQPTTAPSITAPTVPPAPNVSLIPQMSPIRHQQNRGTCVAHAALAVYEHYLNVNGALQDLSEQFLYWNCKSNDGIPNLEGTWLATAIPLLQREGCCLAGC